MAYLKKLVNSFKRKKTKDDQLRKSKVFCMAPWVHQHVSPDGSVRLCCESDGKQIIGNLNDEGQTLSSLWNAKKIKNARESMIKGEKLGECWKCYEIESLGRPSYRNYFNEEWEHHYEKVEQTDARGEIKKHNVPFLDLRFNNLCNLKCRICFVEASTSWYPDAVKLGLAAKDAPALITAGDQQVLLEEIKELIPYIEQVHFAGGEPLIAKEHYNVLEELLRQGQLSVRLKYNTNFSKLKVAKHDIIDIWKNFTNVRVDASLDGFGVRGDYMRKGQKWSQIVQNRKVLAKQCPHVEFNIHCTVSVMNIFHVLDFYKQWVMEGLVDPYKFDVYPLHEPIWFNIQGLPQKAKVRVTDLYQQFIEKELPILGVSSSSETATKFRSIVNFMMKVDLDTQHSFVQKVSELDTIRSERFESLFPEVAKYYDFSLVE